MACGALKDLESGADRVSEFENSTTLQMMNLIYESKPGRSFAEERISASPLFLPRWMMISRFSLRGAIWLQIASAVGIIFVLYAAFHLPRSRRVPGANPDGNGYFGHYGEETLPGVFPGHMGPDTVFSSDFDICSVCRCSESSNPSYGPSGRPALSLPPRPVESDIHPSRDTIDLNEFVHLTLLDMYCAGHHLTTPQSLKLLHRATTAFDEVASWSLSDLQLGKPTIYITTVSSPNSKAGPLRPQYFKRHGRAIKSWLNQQAVAGAQSLGFQVLWVVAEDEVDIDPRVALSLRRTGVPHVYFSYGLTKAWGNAQKNAVLQMVNALSRYAPSNPTGQGIFGHGPVYGLDDDNKMLSDLLTVLTRVVRCGVFPVGNLHGPGGWESPTMDEKGELTGADGPWTRPFSFDYGGYSFNSSLLGPVITGPKFWKWEAYAGETEFLAQIVGNVRDLEPICGPTTADQEKCHFVWHNEPLTDAEKATDEEDKEFAKKHGVKALFSRLGYEWKESG